MAIHGSYTTPLRESDLNEKLIFTFILIPQLTLPPAQIYLLQSYFLYSNVFFSIIIQLLPPIIEVSCFFFFFMALTYPIQTSIQQLSVSHFEIILSSPVKPKDMLLGNFIGRVPIYAIADFILVPIFWTILSIFVPLPIISFFSF